MRPHVAVRGSVLLLFAIFLITQNVVAQFWDKKPYQQWSKDETVKMLSDSPWARETIITDVRASTVGNQKATGNNNAGSKVTYQVQIRSAQPVRAAIVHLQQLGPRYQQMSAEQKQKVDANAENFINAKSDEISFWVNYSCDVANLDMDLRRYWETQTLGTLNNTIFLQISGAQKLDPTYFAPGPDHSLEIRFQRPKGVPADGSLTLRFNHPKVETSSSWDFETVLTEFKIKKMAFSGAPTF